jgi:hypothetical protein
LVLITDRNWLQDATLIITQIRTDPLTFAAPRAPLSDAQAVV